MKGDDPALAATAEAFLWKIWCRSGSREVDGLFRAGVEAMQRRKLPVFFLLEMDFGRSGACPLKMIRWRLRPSSKQPKFRLCWWATFLISAGSPLCC